MRPNICHRAYDRVPVEGDVSGLLLTEELKDVFRVGIGDRQRLDAELLLGLERLQTGRLLVHVRIDETADTASTLGAITTRIEMQENFVATLTDVIDKGVGRLVDADMNEESTRLKALQTQQQLGIQSLSIANTNSENILQLFRQ